MRIEFKKFIDYDRGVLCKQLMNAYSFNPLWKEHFEQDWVEYDDFFYEHLDFTNDCGFIMVVDGDPIEHLSWDPRNLPEYVIIGHNCILTEYKGQGYGRILLEEAVNRIKKYKGIKKIIVTTNDKLIPAQRNYESAGFKIRSKRENNDTPFSGDYIDYEMIL